jgi:hypothetical protein
MKKYNVYSTGDSFDTDSLDEANSVMESMAIHLGYAVITDNETKEIIDKLDLW